MLLINPIHGCLHPILVAKTVSLANMSIGILFNQVLECVGNVRLGYWSYVGESYWRRWIVNSGMYLHITTCLILHNFTIMHNDTFNMSWFKDGQTQLQRNFTTRSIAAATSTTLLEAEIVAIPPIDFLHCTSLDSDNIPSVSNYCFTTHEMSMRQDAIAKSLFSRIRQKNLAENLDDIHVGLSSLDSNWNCYFMAPMFGDVFCTKLINCLSLQIK